jgi:hypothetical protein
LKECRGVTWLRTSFTSIQFDPRSFGNDSLPGGI